ncbi:MAG: cob(I)yrinic acid a,c-diamide adenosyltransferase [Armatimonadetes bacterium]|nr:cob(I)yrinic acid a,c-diamide adenosyltransferase [Armatimonadota bacterium]NIM23136.1 cob(I)yrinic acid a,c-diamide adenosyltransferase [Armatimonadota bacterium]NIM67004.1 cob(I)yrinic acid a,c-diamide adenosyltransferase [Armatimonadota bacterium]NIM75538.1 cob(I)yrinic acid a,c-diamide adenosyltransferase [Armatimonadota bacterium]NIN05193.1 cob(I)yrinic acid a,c-diamide adenosyltransferase [Armatimonadota bacterium]
MRLKRGLVQVYTGDGKGKTTASLGLAWRAMGHGLKVCYIQFMKGATKSGEELSAGVFGGLFHFVSISADAQGAGRKSLPDEPWWTQPLTEADRACAKEALAFAHKALKSGEYDIVICDEINVACDMGLVAVEEILTLVREKPPNVELVLTGRNAKEEVIAAADLVTEMRSVKHPFSRDISARKGIEF